MDNTPQLHKDRRGWTQIVVEPADELTHSVSEKTAASSQPMQPRAISVKFQGSIREGGDHLTTTSKLASRKDGVGLSK